ncbi:MAG TPA: IS66 family transposase [Candidatus Methylomirabilis sp.]|nr:IS66 family transposase [Candidatus Methylomirabilis sp.]
MSPEELPRSEEDKRDPQRVVRQPPTDRPGNDGNSLLTVPLTHVPAASMASPEPAASTIAGAAAETAQTSNEDRNDPQKSTTVLMTEGPAKTFNEDRNDPQKSTTVPVTDGPDHHGRPLLTSPRSSVGSDQPVTAPAGTTAPANVVVGQDNRTVVTPGVPPGEPDRPGEGGLVRPTDGVVGATTIITAPPPSLPWPRCLAGVGLLAYLVVSKFVDHLPLYRLERILLRDGVWLRRSTLCDWLAGCARVLEPLYQLLWQRVFQSGYVRTDDTSVRVQGQTTQGRLWGYLSGGQQRYTVYDFTLDHTQDRPVSCLQEVQGYIQADGYKGYDKVYGAERIEVGCWAHARRYFFEARDQDPVRACYVLGWIGQLYAWEAAARYAQEVQEMSEEEYWDLREQIRERQSVPLLTQLGVYLEAERDKVLPLSKIGEAFRYLHNQWAALQVYVKHGFLEIDNNGAERALRGIGIGRKNWLFLGSAEGGRTAAILYSLTETCQQNGVDPWWYVREMLRILPGLTEAEREEALPRLLPDVWAQTQRDEADSRAPP